MKNETALLEQVPAARKKRLKGTDDALNTRGRPRRANDDELLAYCDGYFQDMMSTSLTDEARQKRGLPPQPAKGVSEKDRYLKAQQAGKFAANRAMRRRLDRKLGPERGLGARVFIGFDAEWTRSRKGRNRILSVQFYLIGPTGEVLTLVIHIENGDIVSQRPRLSDVIYDLLESALDQGVIEEWPARSCCAASLPAPTSRSFPTSSISGRNSMG